MGVQPVACDETPAAFAQDYPTGVNLTASLSTPVAAITVRTLLGAPTAKAAVAAMGFWVVRSPSMTIIPIIKKYFVLQNN